MAFNKISAGLTGFGSSLPEKILTNQDLEKMVDTSNEWIIRRTGISQRRILEDSTPAFKLGARAAKDAISDAGLEPGDIELIIVTTETPDYLTPSMACLIQNEIGAKNAAAFDLNAACSGFVYGITVAGQFISTGYYKNILVVGCEGLSRVTDWKDRNTCVLFGDGAGAAVVNAVEEGYGIISTQLGADGAIGHNITIPCCYASEEDNKARECDNKSVIWMNGSEVLKFAVRVMAQATKDVIKQAGITIDDIKIIVPHQANVRIINGAAKRLKISDDRVYINVDRYGNMSSACIPIALDELMKKNILKKDDYFVLVGFGGGLTWASALLKWQGGS